jgi:hypothetical protein
MAQVDFGPTKNSLEGRKSVLACLEWLGMEEGFGLTGIASNGESCFGPQTNIVTSFQNKPNLERPDFF